MLLIRILLVGIIVYYLLKFAVRFILPIFLKYAIRKTQENYQHQYRDTYRKTGETKTGFSQTKKMDTSEIGEYVDYEEIKE